MTAAYEDAADDVGRSSVALKAPGPDMADRPASMAEVFWRRRAFKIVATMVAVSSLVALALGLGLGLGLPSHDTRDAKYLLVL